MMLAQLEVHGLRNLRRLSLSFQPTINFIFGANGSGKTSLLEAIYLLGRGRSFRSRHLTTLINHEMEECTVFGQVVPDTDTKRKIPVGIHRSRSGDFVSKVDGRLISSASELAETLPLQLLNNHSFQLLEGGPDNRRRFMDWGVFHVEHGCRVIWQRLRKCLKQRNSLLRRDRMDMAQISVWNREISSLADDLTTYRQQYLNRLTPVVKDVIGRLSPLPALSIEFYPGWDITRSLEEVLVDDLERDRKARVTHHGPHRADIRVKCGGKPVTEVLSRGQMKILVSGMQLAQGYLFKDITGRHCLYLLDDLPAELDKQHRARVGGLLNELGVQAFITGTDRNELQEAWPKDKFGNAGVFHVEHGKFSVC